MTNIHAVLFVMAAGISETGGRLVPCAYCTDPCDFFAAGS